MAVLLIAEVNGGELSVDSTAKAMAAAKQLGDVTVLCVGSGCSGQPPIPCGFHARDCFGDLACCG